MNSAAVLVEGRAILSTILVVAFIFTARNRSINFGLA